MHPGNWVLEGILWQHMWSTFYRVPFSCKQVFLNCAIPQGGLILLEAPGRPRLGYWALGWLGFASMASGQQWALFSLGTDQHPRTMNSEPSASVRSHSVLPLTLSFKSWPLLTTRTGWGGAETTLRSRVTSELCLRWDNITPELRGCEGSDLTNHMFKQHESTLLFEGAWKHISK